MLIPVKSKFTEMMIKENLKQCDCLIDASSSLKICLYYLYEDFFIWIYLLILKLCKID